MATVQELSEAIQKGQAPKAKELTQSLLAAKTSAADVLNKGLLDGMEKIGKKFKANEVYIPEVLIAARAMSQSMEVLKPELVKAGVDVLDISPACAESPADLAMPFRQFGVPVIAVGEMDNPGRAAEVLTRKRADFVAVGRGLIADPEWPRKVQEGRVHDIVRCTRCNVKCYGHLPKMLPIECTQWQDQT